MPARRTTDTEPSGPGWAIFDASDSQLNRDGNCPLQLQKDDEAGVFQSDDEAHRHVVDLAKRGERLAIDALTQLRADSKPELAIVYANARGEDRGWQAFLNPSVHSDEALDTAEIALFGALLTR